MDFVVTIDFYRFPIIINTNQLINFDSYWLYWSVSDDRFSSIDIAEYIYNGYQCNIFDIAVSQKSKITKSKITIPLTLEVGLEKLIESFNRVR